MDLSYIMKELRRIEMELRYEAFHAEANEEAYIHDADVLEQAQEYLWQYSDLML